MPRNALPSEAASVAAVIAPASYAAGTNTSGWVDLSKFGDAMAIINGGVLGASATVDAKLEQATSSAGAGAKDITGKAITQLTKAGGDDGKQVIINVNDSQLDVNNGYAFVRLSLTTAVAASVVSAMLIALNPRYGPASDFNPASVKQIVA